MKKGKFKDIVGISEAADEAAKAADGIITENSPSSAAKREYLFLKHLLIRFTYFLL